MPNKMGGTVKAWKQKVGAWIKRVLIIAAIVIAVGVGLFLLYKLYVGVRKKALLKEIGELQAQINIPASSGGPSPVELAQLSLLSRLVNTPSPPAPKS